jgi:hypothetical protein
MMAAKPERRDPSVCLAKLSQRDLSLGLHSCPPEFPFCLSAANQYTTGCLCWRSFSHFFRVCLAKIPSGRKTA